MSHLSRIMAEAKRRSDWAEIRFGKHPSSEFTCCRIAEEVGELIQAATSTSKGRDMDRAPRILDEAIDAIAMIVRLIEPHFTEELFKQVVEAKP